MYRCKTGMLIHKVLWFKCIYKTVLLFNSRSKNVVCFFFFFDRVLSGEVSTDSWSHADFSEALWTLLSIFCRVLHLQHCRRLAS